MNCEHWNLLLKLLSDVLSSLANQLGSIKSASLVSRSACVTAARGGSMPVVLIVLSILRYSRLLTHAVVLQFTLPPERSAELSGLIRSRDSISFITNAPHFTARSGSGRSISTPPTRRASGARNVTYIKRAADQRGAGADRDTILPLRNGGVKHHSAPQKM